MAILDMRWRTGSVFAVLALTHILIISAQVTNSQGASALEQSVFGAFSQLQRGFSIGLHGIGGVWDNYVAVGQVRNDNERLRLEVGDLRIRLQQERSTASQAGGLLELLQLRDAIELPTRAASIIGVGVGPEFQIVSIDRGTDDGVFSDMAVIAPAGVVGRVIRPSASAARVQLLIDRNAAAGVLVERSRTQGVVMGFGGDRLQLDFIVGWADVLAGDRVVTSGTDGIYPKGLLVGQIESVSREREGFGMIVVHPAVDFGRLEDVLVVTLTPSDGGQAGGP